MKCPNCGAEMKEGTLYCEHCGEDIHIVPDFEPEIEYNMEQTLHDIAREMTPEEDATDDQDAQQSMTELQDWDEEPLENTAKHPFRWKFIVLILVLAVVAVVCTGFGISYCCGCRSYFRTTGKCLWKADRHLCGQGRL